MKERYFPAIFAGIGLIILILDTKTALSAGAAGIEICMHTLIPTLFPFLFLSGLLTSSLRGVRLPLTRLFNRLLRIPRGAESIFIIGLLGGYPVGAQCIADAVNSGTISRENGSRMLSFCSNAGPSFIFGIGSRLFPDPWMCWAIWGIHIGSAVLTATLMPPVSNECVRLVGSKASNSSMSLRKAVQNMAMVCGWVILFRILLAFLQQWFLWILPQGIQVAICGILELANGCCMLMQIQDIPMRFILFSATLAFGGICVAMQTNGVCTGINCNGYLYGKLLQTGFSLLLSYMVISQEMHMLFGIILLAICFSFSFYLLKPIKRNRNFRQRGI